MRCRFFGRYAEALGVESLLIELAEGALVGDAVEEVRRRLSNGRMLPATPLAAVNLKHVPLDAPLADGDEMALLPPLAGG